MKGGNQQEPQFLMIKANCYVPIVRPGVAVAGQVSPGPAGSPGAVFPVVLSAEPATPKPQRPGELKQQGRGAGTASGRASPAKPAAMPTATSARREGERPRSTTPQQNGEVSPPEAAKRPKRVHVEEETNEDIYCRALAQTLHHLALPVTVGFYGEWGRNKDRLLDTIQDQLCQRSEQHKDGKEEARSLRSLIALVWHIMFYLPVSSATKPTGVRYLFVNFNAWEYVGCDHTWAGLVTTLLDEIEGNDIVAFSVFRAYGGAFKEEPGAPAKKWVLKSRGRLVLFYASVLFLILVLVILLLSKILGHRAREVVEYLMIPATVACCIPFARATKNVCFTLKRKLQRGMSRKDQGAQLGFMHSVKQDVDTVIRYLQFMAFQEEQEMRVVLKIINLDLCTPNKVVGVLDAVSILLSDKDAPFISILVADPGILVECIQWSSNACSNGYLYLDRIVSLPFSLPQMSDKAKRQLLKEILTRKNKREKNGRSSRRASDPPVSEDVQKLLRHLSHESFSDYIPGNSTQMKRVVNTVLTILSMLRLGFKPRLRLQADGKEERVSIQEVVDWVILANCWPCRLSWILQCEEDDRQQRTLNLRHAAGTQRKTSIGQGRDAKPQKEAPRNEGKSLLAFYEENAGELDHIKYKIRKLLELDGDPDLFRIFLRKNHFTVERARYFADLLINLDFSLKRQFVFLRGLDGITRSSKASSKSLSGEKTVSCHTLKKFSFDQKENVYELSPNRQQTTPEAKDLGGSAVLKHKQTYTDLKKLLSAALPNRQQTHSDPKDLGGSAVPGRQQTPLDPKDLGGSAVPGRQQTPSDPKDLGGSAVPGRQQTRSDLKTLASSVTPSDSKGVENKAQEGQGVDDEDL